MHQQLIEAWRTNNRINLLLLEKITDAGMLATLSARGGRGVAGELAHMHNIRVWHVEKRAKEHLGKLERFATGEIPSRAQLAKAFKQSGDAVEKLLVGVLEGKPKHRGFKKGIFTTLSYFIAHEAHHRGRILLTLKVSRNTLDKTTQTQIWGWDQM